MSDTLEEASRRNSEALQRVIRLRRSIEARKVGSAGYAPTVAQGEPTEQPSKPEKRGGQLSTIGRLARIFSIKTNHNEQERNRIWQTLYPGVNNPYR